MQAVSTKTAYRTSPLVSRRSPAQARILLLFLMTMLRSLATCAARVTERRSSMHVLNNPETEAVAVDATGVAPLSDRCEVAQGAAAPCEKETAPDGSETFLLTLLRALSAFSS